MNHRAENHDEHADQHAIDRLRGEPSQKLEGTPDGQDPDHPGWIATALPNQPQQREREQEIHPR